MDLELLLRACWRHRVRLLAGMLLGAVLVAGGGKLLLSPKYVSSTDLAVSPVTSSLLDDPTTPIYTQNPDRYVATQVEVLSARGTAAEVAKQLGVDTDTVLKAVSVAQLNKSDVIRVSATTTSPDLSASIAERLVKIYLADKADETTRLYDLALKSVRDQAASITKQIASTRDSLADSGQTDNALGILQQRLSGLLAQQSDLTTQGQQLQVQRTTGPTSAKVVSSAAADPVPVGPGTKLLIAYGMALGLAVGLCIIAIVTRPGQSLEELARSAEIDGTPVLGVVVDPPGLRFAGLRRATPIDDLRNMRVADQISTLVQLKGAVQFVVVGPAASARRVKAYLNPLVLGPMPDEFDHEDVGNLRSQRRAATEGEFHVLSLASFLPGQVERGVVVVGVDLERVSRPQLDDVLAGLDGIGAEVLGIVGIT